MPDGDHIDAAPEPDDDGTGRKTFLITGASLVDAEDEVGDTSLAVECELVPDVVGRPEADDLQQRRPAVVVAEGEVGHEHSLTAVQHVPFADQRPAVAF